jgi:hypothetical protein
MATPRQTRLARLLEEKYGIVGKVAGRYVTAGLHVAMMHPTRYGPIHFVAQGNGLKLAVDVVAEGDPLKAAELLKKKAELLKAKPVLVLYGLAGAGIEKLAEMGVEVRKFKG